MEGQTLSHYTVLEKLGGGGMGVVYKALDTHLDRHVALKLLPPELTRDDEARERFVLEAKAASALDHPNICTIYDIDETPDGQMFIAMGFYDGETLKQRIAKGPLPIDEALNIAIQMAQGLAEAHAADIVHRDIKPANVMLTKNGLVKIVDFGIAKLLGVTGPTQTGTTVGTVGYMSPEQLAGKETDQRTDVWSLGAVLYEMLTGRPPFTGDNQWAVIGAISGREPDSLHALRSEIPREVETVVLRALKKQRRERYPSTKEFVEAVSPHRPQPNQVAGGAGGPPSPWRALMRPAIGGPALAVVLLVAAITWSVSDDEAVRQVAEVTIPEIDRLIEEDRYADAFRLAEEAERTAPEAAELLVDVWPRISLEATIETDPPGAEVRFRDYAAPDNSWQSLGPAPIVNQRLPLGLFAWNIRMAGYEPRTLGHPNPHPYLGNDSFAPPQTISLDKEGNIPPGMVRVDARPIWVALNGFQGAGTFPGPTYWMDQYEVTNEKFKQFVDAGGYRRREFWKETFTRDGRVLLWEEAVDRFRDATERPGPATWQVGTYREGEGSFPVTGVSWYEAAAYAEFVGKALPRLHHWAWVAGTNNAAAITPLSNMSGQGLAPVGQHPGIGWFGAFDMAGNAREWVWNESGSEGDRYMLGGAWNEPDYTFGFPQALSPFDRSGTNGFRLALYSGGVPDDVFSRPIEFPTRDYTQETPVSEDVFQAYADFYSYDQTPLDEQTALVDEAAEHWRVEKATFNAAYEGERVTAFVFLPNNTQPPYQTVLYFPGSGALRTSASAPVENLQVGVFGFLVMSGRAVVVPVYKGTYERQTTRRTDWGDTTSEYRTLVIQQVNDARRTIDYLETRADIDLNRLGYYGFSWGGQMSSIVLALEERLKAAVLLVAGLWAARPASEVDPFNFAPRVTVPVLMLNGEDDFIFPPQTAQQALHNTLGSVEKRQITYAGGHSLLFERRNQVVRDALDFFEEQLGPVN